MDGLLVHVGSEVVMGLMSEDDVRAQELRNTGTTWTRNKEFDKEGYLVVRDLWDPEELKHPVPDKKGQYSYWGKNLDQYNFQPVELQVEGSIARYWHPQYRTIHSSIRFKLEKIIGRDLYNTYYYDRYYFAGQDLTKHVDRDACEISVSIHIGTNLKGKDADWPFCIQTPSGDVSSLILQPGDGVIYKGCERPHWRDEMTRKKYFFSRGERYYHQIFFHYVLQDGVRSHCAFDR